MRVFRVKVSKKRPRVASTGGGGVFPILHAFPFDVLPARGHSQGALGEDRATLESDPSATSCRWGRKLRGRSPLFGTGPFFMKKIHPNTLRKLKRDWERETRVKVRWLGQTLVDMSLRNLRDINAVSGLEPDLIIHLSHPLDPTAR